VRDLAGLIFARPGPDDPKTAPWTYAGWLPN